MEENWTGFSPKNQGDAVREIRTTIFVLAFLSIPARGWSQDQFRDESALVADGRQMPAPPCNEDSECSDGKDDAAPPNEPAVIQPNKKDDSRGQQSKRVFWIVPNFGAVDANKQLPPLSTGEKFSLAAHDGIVDYSTSTWIAVLAGQGMLLNSDPELSPGIKGYGRYY